jgi:UDP-GlcNAc:undecaprenyl-phosphate GlcNAc-1-phosphate transferase
MVCLYIFILALLVSFLLLPVGIELGKKWKIFSKPKGTPENKSCLGGIIIFVAFLMGLLPIHFLKISFDNRFESLVISSAIIILLGMFDDAKDLRPSRKIMVELLAILFLIRSGIVTKVSFLPGWANILITFLWVLFITNAFNLLDIIDGLTSGLVIIISSTLLAISLINKDIFSGTLLAALIGAHMGFLKYNYPPAKLYMGDTGSLFSGFLLAAVSINISYAPLERPVALLTPMLTMSIPIYDTLFLIIMRVKKRKPIFNKSNDHFALRLVTMGYTVRKSIWVMYIFSIFLAVSSLIVAFGSNLAGILATIVILLVFILMGKKVGMVNI